MSIIQATQIEKYPKGERRFTINGKRKGGMNYGRRFSQHPKAKYWSNKNKLKPFEVAYCHNNKYWFDCPNCPHEFEASTSNIVAGKWCSYCSRNKLCNNKDCSDCFNKSFASHSHAKHWSDKNILKPREVFKNYNTKVWFYCDICGHDFKTSPNTLVSNTKKNKDSWCKFCCNFGKRLCEDDDCVFCFENSFASNPKAKYWAAKNTKSPREVTTHNGNKYWFTCPNCPHYFHKTVSAITGGKDSWCPYCAGAKLCGDKQCQHCFNRSFASHSRAKFWSNKNEKKAHEVALHSQKKFWFDCDTCAHEFEMCMSSITGCYNSWCVYCQDKLCFNSECQHCFKRSFASHPKSKYWSTKNTKTPREVRYTSHLKCWFDCDICGHDFYKNVSLVTRRLTQRSGRKIGQMSGPTWCPYCVNQARCSAITCEMCFKNSFASHHRAKFWSKKNTKTPREFALYSNKKCWFDCEEGHEFSTSLTNVVKGNWCPHCTHKTEKKLYQWFQAQPWVKETKHRWRPKWCSTQYMYLNTKGDFKLSKYQYEYDFLITLQNGKQLIIELDGAQHFVQVSNWKGPFHNQIRDVYKERKARQHRIPVIRILQEDVWFDRGDWKGTLTKKFQ